MRNNRDPYWKVYLGVVLYILLLVYMGADSPKNPDVNQRVTAPRAP